MVDSSPAASLAAVSVEAEAGAVGAAVAADSEVVDLVVLAAAALVVAAQAEAGNQAVAGLLCLGVYTIA